MFSTHGFESADDMEPSTADLAAIEAEMPLIEAEGELVDAEIRLLTADPAPLPLDWKRVRRAERRVLRTALALLAAGAVIEGWNKPHRAAA